MTLQKTFTLADFDSPSVMEVLEASHCVNSNGEGMGIIKVKTVKKDRKEFKGKIIIPERVLHEVADCVPCVVVYFGKAVSASGREYYDVRRIASCGDGSPSALAAEASRLRAMDDKVLRAEMKVERLADFPAGSILACWGLECVKIENTKIPIVYYETELTDKASVPERGRVFLPSRILPTIKSSAACVVKYNGERTSKNGRKYNDVEVVTSEDDLTIAPPSNGD